MPVIVSTPRDQLVTFSKQFGSYFGNEEAAFSVAEKTALAAKGVIAADPAAAPVNITAPFVSQQGAVMTSTVGTWNGEPTGYAFQWKSNAANVGTNAATYTVVAGDIGHTMTCIVTATNAIGSTASPPSNGVVAA